MESRTKSILWFGVSTAIILGMIYFADLRRVVDALRAADIFLLAPAFFFGLMVFPIWGYTWYQMFQSMSVDISYIKSLTLFMAGTFFNSVTPLGQFGGEPFMAYIVAKNSDSSSGKAFSAVLSADIINTVPIFTFVVGGAIFQAFFGSLNQVITQVIYVALLTTVVGGTLVYLLWFKAGKVENAIVNALYYLTGKIGRGKVVARKVEDKLMEVQEAFAQVGNNPVVVVKTSIVAHIGFLAQVMCLAFILMSLGHSFDFTPLYFTITLASLANFSPTPGGSGTFEAAMAGFLTIFLNMSFPPALVAAIIFRFTTFWPGLIIGYISFNTLEKVEME